MLIRRVISGIACFAGKNKITCFFFANVQFFIDVFCFSLIQCFIKWFCLQFYFEQLPVVLNNGKAYDNILSG